MAEHFMTEPLSESRVIVLINQQIERYDTKQDQRHRENSRRLDDNYRAVQAVKELLVAEMSKNKGVTDYRQWLFPTVLSLAMVVVTIVQIWHH